jgi:hypothetical protein
MRFSRQFIICCSALAAFSFTGCNKAIRPISIDVDPSSLAPIGEAAVPGQVLEWFAIKPGESFIVNFKEKGLCKEQGPLEAHYRAPARCTVVDQNLKPSDPPIIFHYTLSGTVDGKPIENPVVYSVAARGPGGCPWCQNAK